FIEHAGIPTLPAVRLAVDALQELDMHRKVQLVVSGGIRTGADVAKALALGADAVSIGTAALIAMGDNSPEHDAEYRALGSAADGSRAGGRSPGFARAGAGVPCGRRLGRSAGWGPEGRRFRRVPPVRTTPARRSRSGRAPVPRMRPPSHARESARARPRGRLR